MDKNSAANGKSAPDKSFEREERKLYRWEGDGKDVSGLSFLSLLIGLISLVVVVAAPVAVVMSAVTILKIRGGAKGNKMQAYAGLALGLFMTLSMIFLLVKYGMPSMPASVSR